MYLIVMIIQHMQYYQNINMTISFITFSEVFIYHVSLNKISTALENLMRIIIDQIKNIKIVNVFDS